MCCETIKDWQFIDQYNFWYMRKVEIDSEEKRILLTENKFFDVESVKFRLFEM